MLQSANQNLSNTQKNLGIFYYTVKNKKLNINKAMYYLTLAANNNDPTAQNNLGIIYYEGIFMEQNIEKAINYFIPSANENLKEDLFNLDIVFNESKNRNLNEKSSQLNISNVFYEGFGLQL